MVVKIVLSMAGIFAVVGLLFLLSFGSVQIGNDRWATVFVTLGFVIVILFFFLGKGRRVG